MKILLSLFSISICFSAFSQKIVKFSGLQEEVEIMIDPFGVPHIYAKNENDMFFAQGFQAASDRLFQFEMWRRQARGLLSELLGERELQKDIASRLFTYRGDPVAEFNHYHPNGYQIIHSFVNGVNAAIDAALLTPDSLPVEFRLLGIKPQYLKPEDIISRHQGLLGNLTDEWETALVVHQIGEDKTKEINWYHPNNPDLKLDSLVKEILSYSDVMDLYKAFKRPVNFLPEDILAFSDRNSKDNYMVLSSRMNEEQISLNEEKQVIGSNNWVVSGALSESGFPLLANDPHRAMSAPSLRYITHLVSPGWNVIGGGEPTIPGVSIGHNEYGAWGLTIHATDAEDMYVYELNPSNVLQYKYQGKWLDFLEIKDSISVKGKGMHYFSLFYSVHGPVLKMISEKNIAVAVRCAWLEKGGAPYLASLRMNQAKNWDEFKLACTYSHIPGENMIWADRLGNIGWQTVGIAPIRNNSSGMVPVIGDGSRDWDGFIPISERPSSYNPSLNYVVTANENVVPLNFKYPNTVGFTWSDPYRGLRIKEYLGSGKKQSVQDFMMLQTDYLSLPARQLVPFIFGIPAFKKLEKFTSLFNDWDYKLTPNSIAATIYDSWERVIFSEYKLQFVPESVRSLVTPQLKMIMDNLLFPDAKFGYQPVQGRNDFLFKTFEKAIQNLEQKLGKEVNLWQYGQLKNKYILLKHPLSAVVNQNIRSILEVGPAQRGGNGFTANLTGRGDNQTHGASFRFISDLQNWDYCLATNTPGQSGNPNSPFYRNLFPIWVNNQYFPLYFSKVKISSVSQIQRHLFPN
jgi:penicillin G amidase